MPWRLRLRNRSALITLFAALLTALAAASAPRLLRASELSPEHRAWIETVEPLLTDEERRGFAELERNHQRDAFIARFWHERGDFETTWESRLRLAQAELGATVSDRARTLLQIGPPQHILTDLCPDTFYPTEAWFYPGIDSRPDGFYLVFVSTSVEIPDYRLWSPDLDPATIALPDIDAARALSGCARRHEWEMVVANALSWSEISAASELMPPQPDDWVAEFLDQTIRLDPTAAAMTAALELTFPGRIDDSTVAQVVLRIPTEVLSPSETDPPTYQLRIDGQILRLEALRDQFRYRFDVPVTEAIDGAVALAFQRHLLPGSYTLILGLEDLASGSEFRSEGPLRVPRPQQTTSLSGSPLDEANAVLASADHMLKIQPLADELYTGRVRIEAVATGDEIAKVLFALDGRPAIAKTRPPYSVELDLGRAPRLHSLEAIALDASGQELARDEVPINAGPHRFSVRLIQPRAGQAVGQSLRAAAEVHLPEGETLDRVDFFLNEIRVATLYQEPFAQPLLLPRQQRLSYVRAVAHLEDGSQTEDLVFVNAPSGLDHLRINMVELYTTVQDSKGHPVEGLTAADFEVLEEGERQSIRRFELVDDLSVHAGVVVDASTSMEEEIGVAIEGALDFFASVIRPKDRAAVVVFNDRPVLQVPFTNDLQRLASGLERVVSEGETALYDTLVYSLYYFAGLRGKRALIVISDGEDSNSRHSFEEALDFARRSGVAIYPIALGLDRRSLQARGVLMRLARETGGRFFSIGGARELEGIYRAIDQELRSQYLLVYQSTHEEGGDFRRVEVEVSVPGLKARTIPGYYP